MIHELTRVLKYGQEKRLFRVAVICLIAFSVSTAIAQTGTRSMTVDDLLQVQRVGDPQLSPDGKWIAYTVTVPDKVSNRRETQIFLVSIDGGKPDQLTADPTSAIEPRWSPDGARIAFVTNGQIWTMDREGNDRKQVTKISTEAYDPVWSNDGRLIAFVSDVYPDCSDDECNRQRDERVINSKVWARTTDRLPYRNSIGWRDGKRTHIFIASVEGGPARDLTPGEYDAPPVSLGGPVDYAFSPDSKELAFVCNVDKNQATSTNSDIWLVSVAGGAAKNITLANHGYDGLPRFSLDGRFIAYCSQVTPGFESDRVRLMIYDRRTGQVRSLTENFDSWVDEFVFSPDSTVVYFASVDRGKEPIYSVPVNGGPIRIVVAEGFNGDISVSTDGKTLVFSRSSMIKPSEIYRTNVDGSGIAQITKTNDSFLKTFDLKLPEKVSWTGAANQKISGWVLKPTGFQPGKKYPLLVLVHGGPQSAWNDSWSYLWNPQVFAGAGYVVFMPNPRGSTGYGQQFVNEISGDWGGKAYTDIMNGVAYILDQGFADRERIGAAGGSYGGYIVNWIEGHNSDARFKFKVLVAHAGAYNLTSLYGESDELWFYEWEMKGTPWNNPEMYTRWSPSMFVKNFKTPLLVTHGRFDYRTPVEQSLQLFTALQVMGVESKLVVFPDEGHWILRPENSALWYTTLIAWFDRYLKSQRGG